MKLKSAREKEMDRYIETFNMMQLEVDLEIIGEQVDMTASDIRFYRLEDAMKKVRNHSKADAFLEKLSGKTHLLHIHGSKKHIDSFVDELHKRNHIALAKWIVVPYTGVIGKWHYRRKRANVKNW